MVSKARLLLGLLLGIGPTLGAAPEPAAPPPAPRPPNLLLFMVDTLRADVLGCYGNERIRTPEIDALAAEGTVFVHANAPVPATRPSIASLMTGVPADVHGVFSHQDVLSGQVAGLPRLAERLAARGYTTAALVANPNVDRVFGFARGFDHYEGLYETRHGRRPATSRDLVSDAAVVVSRARALIAELEPRRPWFLFVLAIDPHAPYTPPAPFDRIYNPLLAGSKLGKMSAVLDFDQRLKEGENPSPLAMRTLYEGEVSFVDREFGRLLGKLRESGELDHTLVVLTAAHGEEFAEHGHRGHGKTLYEETTRVPLILRHPRWFRHAVRRERVDLLDLSATLLAVAGAQVPAFWTGRDLRGPLGQRSVVSSNHFGEYSSIAIRRGNLKLIKDDTSGAVEVFDLEADPAEKSPLRGDALEAARATLAARLDAYRKQVAALKAKLARTAVESEDEPVPEGIEKTLESLGYVGGKKR
ncbi:MAG TPA: hypothetical protein ENK10_00820 [Acidobacteria bacterium]|nr:hypothetical protein [Acidobacteriota bacterium]